MKYAVAARVLVGLVVASVVQLAIPQELVAPCQAADWYVSPQGSDRWSGKLSEANAARTDGPFASLVAARDAIRRARAAGQTAEPMTVHVRGGTYRLDAPLVLEPSDSGTAQAPVVYQAYPNERPVLSGGMAITGFRQNGQLWEVTIPEVQQGKLYFRQLFVGGQRRTRARSPNKNLSENCHGRLAGFKTQGSAGEGRIDSKDYFHIAGTLPGPRDHQGKAIARDKFLFSPGDLKPWARLKDVNLILMHSWETSIHPLQSVNEKTQTVTFAAPLKEWWQIGLWEPTQRYYVENAFELLDSPGEWYLNRETGVLSYWPIPGEKLGETEVIAPRLGELVHWSGDVDRGRWVEHVTLRGLAFAHSDWELSPKGNSSTQAAVEVPAAVMADGARNCALEGCEVAHVGTYGVWFRRGCKDCRIQKNRLFDLGAGGIRVGEANKAATDDAESSRNLVDNNHIFDAGHVYAAGIGIWVAQSSYNRITHNDIHHLLYSGMSIGWNWNDDPNRTHHNLIEWNHVHDIAQGVLSDVGAIYCLGTSPGSVIRNNIFHDVWPYMTPAIGWGIYLDATTSGYLVENNLVYNTLSGGMMYNNGGHEHVIQNNIFALSSLQALWPFWEKRPSTFRRNIIYWTQGSLMVGWADNSLKQRIAAKEWLGTWDENLYWFTEGAEKIRVFRHTLPQWQALGLDQRSLVADPRFVDVARHDFRLKPGSHAEKIGFKPFDSSDAGLYGDAAWKGEASHAKCPVRPIPPPPPPPPPREVDEDFEKLPPGSHPQGLHVHGEEKGASVVISEEQAASGKRSLKVTDTKTLQPSWQPHFFYEPHLREGMIRDSFDVMLAENAQFVVEWRDTNSQPYAVGPSVQFDGGGTVRAGGKTVATIPSKQWVHVEIETQLGKAAPHTFKLTVTPPGQPPKVVENLATGADFAELDWLGFISTAAADTTFYLDNLKIKRVDSPK